MQVACGIASVDGGRGEIRNGCGVKHGDGFVRGEFEKAGREINRGGEREPLLGEPWQGRGSHLAAEEDDGMTVFGESVGQKRAEMSGGEVGESADAVQGFERGAGRDDAAHAGKGSGIEATRMTAMVGPAGFEPATKGL